MTEFFDSVLQFFTTIGTFLETAASGLMQFFKMIPGLFTFMSSSSAYLPTFIAPFFILGISLLVVKVILDLL